MASADGGGSTWLRRHRDAIIVAIIGTLIGGVVSGVVVARVTGNDHRNTTPNSDRSSTSVPHKRGTPTTPTVPGDDTSTPTDLPPPTDPTTSTTLRPAHWYQLAGAIGERGGTDCSDDTPEPQVTVAGHPTTAQAWIGSYAVFVDPVHGDRDGAFANIRLAGQRTAHVVAGFIPGAEIPDGAHYVQVSSPGRPTIEHPLTRDAPIYDANLPYGDPIFSIRVELLFANSPGTCAYFVTQPFVYGRES